MIDKNINTWDELTDYIRKLEEMFQANGHLKVTADWSSKRTNKQSRALHKYCELVAKDLNDAGITFTMFFKDGYEVPWNTDIVKDEIWRPVQRVMERVESTTDLKRNRVSEVYEVVNSKLADHGIHTPWPSKEVA